MAVYPPSAERMAQVTAGMRETIRARQNAAPAPVNLDAALSLFEPIPLLWAGVEYRVRSISYPEGLRLQRLTMRFDKLRTAEVSDESDLDAHEALLEEILTLFHSFLDPKPRENPFLSAAPLEVGALAGFFYSCLRIQNHPSRLGAVRLSRSIS